MKRRTALALIIVIFAALFGCTAGQTEETAPPSAEQSVDENGLPPLHRTLACVDPPKVVCALYAKEPNLEDRLSGNYVIEATFVRDVGFVGDPRSGSYELEFKVEDVLKGSIDEETIYARLSLNSSDWHGGWGEADEPYGEYTIFNYVEGHRYLLIANKDDSVYYDHPLYRISNLDFLPIDDDLGAFVWGHDLATDDSGFIDREKMAELVPGGSYIDYISRLCESRPWVADTVNYPPYTTSTDMYEIAKECEFVLAVTPKREELVSDWRNTATYACDVERVIKNSSVKHPVEIGYELHLPFVIDSIEEGEQYIVMVNRASGADSDSIVFSLAAKTAVYESNEETIAALKEYLAG